MDFDINLTKQAMKQTEAAQELNRQLSRLLADVAAGRGYMIMSGATTVSVVARQDGERKVVKVYPTPLLQARRYTKDEAAKRLGALDPALYRAVLLRDAVAAQGETLAAYHGELYGFFAGACGITGMEVPA